MQKIFRALVPESVYSNPRNLVEYCFFRFLSRNNAEVHPGLKVRSWSKFKFKHLFIINIFLLLTIKMHR